MILVIVQKAINESFDHMKKECMKKKMRVASTATLLSSLIQSWSITATRMNYFYRMFDQL